MCGKIYQYLEDYRIYIYKVLNIILKMYYIMKCDNIFFLNNICVIIIWKNYYIIKDYKRRREIKYCIEFLFK